MLTQDDDAVLRLKDCCSSQNIQDYTGSASLCSMWSWLVTDCLFPSLFLSLIFFIQLFLCLPSLHVSTCGALSCSRPSTFISPPLLLFSSVWLHPFKLGAHTGLGPSSSSLLLASSGQTRWWKPEKRKSKWHLACPQKKKRKKKQHNSSPGYVSGHVWSHAPPTVPIL